MGLDGVEMVMAFENYFGVELENKQCANATTPRLLGDLIFSKLQATDDRRLGVALHGRFQVL